MAMASEARLGNRNFTHSMEGFDPGRRYFDPSYSCNTSIYPQQPMASTPISLNSICSHTSNTSPLLPLPLTYYLDPTRSSYDEETRGAYGQAGSTNYEVSSFSLSRGSFNSKIHVYITSTNEILNSKPPKVSLIFNSREYPASVQKLSQKETSCYYSVTSEVPRQADLCWEGSGVSVSMIIESEDGNLNKVPVREIEYPETANQTDCSFIPVHENTRKRKFSPHPSDSAGTVDKRASPKKLRSKEEYSNYHYSQNETQSPYTFTQASNTYRPAMRPHQYSLQTGNLPGEMLSQNPLYPYSGPRTLESPIIKPSSSLTGNWNSYPNINSKVSQSLGIFQTPNIHRLSQAVAASPSMPANPTLFRTSTLQQSPNSTFSSHSQRSNQQLNPYTLYANKAKLEIIGDLSSMARNWNKEELDSRRRVVLFERSQSGSTITAKFREVRPEDLPKDSMCVSCIYWKEKQACFVTSVDTIYLLQKLVAAQFTVEEKNRIRRNLEGFRPLTVSKGKSDSEEFFKIIMAYPAPKPRNIEKDVKVFHWDDLCGALKKIIGKYSASPSSIVPASTMFLPPSSSNSCVSETTSSTGRSNSSDHTQTSPPQSYSSSFEASCLILPGCQHLTVPKNS